MLNSLIKSVYLHNQDQTYYYLFYLLAFAAVCVYTVFMARRYNLPRWKTTLLSLLILVLCVGWNFVLCWAETGFKEFGGNNTVRGFIWYPVIDWVVCKIFRIPLKPLVEMSSVWPLITQTIGHIGCLFVGCCYGYPWSHGIYNPIMKTTLFPIQILEMAVSALICVVIMIRQHKIHYKVDGLSYPLMLMLYGFTRFFLEFLRDNNKLFWGISNLAIHAFVMFVVGAISFMIVYTKNKRAAQAL